MQLVKLTAASPGVPVGTRSLGKRVRARLRTGNEGGQALVEFALCLPILLLIVTGIFTIGIALHDYLELTDAVSIGARRLAISRGQTTDPCATTATAVYQASPFLSQANIMFTFVLNGTTYSGATCSSSSTTTGAAGNLVQGSAAQVTATYPCKLSVYGSANLLPSCTMTAQMTELIQ
jgi:Flp pilus assembly protein TadG